MARFTIGMDSGASQGTTLVSSSAREGDSESVALRAELEAKPGDANELPEKARSVAEKVNALNVSSALQIMAEAADEVLKLREEQRTLAERAVNEAGNSEVASDLQAENDRLQSRINSIVSGTTFNGTNLLQGSRQFTVRIGDRDINESINTADPAAFVADLGVSLNTQSSARSAQSNIEKALDAGYSFASGIRSAAGKASEIVERSLVPAQSAEDSVAQLDAEEAEALAEDVAAEISDLAQSNLSVDATLQLIDSTTQRLSDEKVRALLDSGE